MPIYEYKCEKCKEKFEVFQGITDGEVKTCKFCGGPVDKLISLFLIFISRGQAGT